MAEIVLLEDDALLSMMLADALEAEGHRVRRCMIGREAMHCCESAAEGGVLVADRGLAGDGGPDGHALAAQALARWPGLRVVYISGAPETAARALSPRERVMLKPLTPADLSRVVRELVSNLSTPD